MANFADATRVEGGGGMYRAQLDSEWFAWGPFGGYIAALAVRALGAESRLPWPATFSGLFLSVGEAGPVEIHVQALRRGKRAEALRASLQQGGRPLFEASAWMVDSELEGLRHDHAAMPAVPSFESLRSYRELDESYDSWYPFWKYIEGRPAQWHHPDDRPAPDPRWHAWMRLTSEPLPDCPALRAATAVMWLDLPAWNAVVNAHPWPLTHITPTLDLTVQFRSTLYEAAAAPEWVLVEGACPTAARGLAGGTGNLWTPGGQLLGLATSQLLCRPNPNYDADLEELERYRSRS